jgi:DNA-binding NtrC family response regulator
MLKPHGAYRDAIDKRLRRGKAYPLKIATDRYVAKVEKSILEHVLATTHWNRKKAAALMDISYKSVLNKIRDYGLT